MIDSIDRGARSVTGSAVTVSHVLGEVAWLMSQSVSHGNVHLRDLNVLIMPPILKRQFHLFRQNDKPVGVAIWAQLDEAGEYKIASGQGLAGSQLDDADWNAGDRLWLLDLVAPFATTENKQLELMFGDLLTGVFRGRSFKIIDNSATDPSKRILTVGEHAGSDLVRLVTEQLSSIGKTQ